MSRAQKRVLLSMVRHRSWVYHLPGGRWATPELTGGLAMGLTTASVAMTWRERLALEREGLLERVGQVLDQDLDPRRLTGTGWETGRGFLPKREREATPATMPAEKG